MIAHKVVTVGVVVVGGLAMLLWWWWRRRQEEEEGAPPAPPEEPPQAPPGLERAGPSGDLNDPNDSDASIITLEIVRRRRGLPEGDDHHPSTGGSNQTEEERGDSLPVRWKKKMDKLARYAPKKTPTFPTCGHHSCSSLAMKDILEFHASFYATRIKAEQDSFLLRFCRLERREKTGKSKLNTRKCFVKAVDGQMVPVCYKTFFGILGVTKHRIAYVLNKYSGTGEVPRENRGGDRRSRKRLVPNESSSKQ